MQVRTVYFWSPASVTAWSPEIAPATIIGESNASSKSMRRGISGCREDREANMAVVVCWVVFKLGTWELEIFVNVQNISHLDSEVCQLAAKD